MKGLWLPEHFRGRVTLEMSKIGNLGGPHLEIKTVNVQSLLTKVKNRQNIPFG